MPTEPSTPPPRPGAPSGACWLLLGAGGHARVVADAALAAARAQGAPLVVCAADRNPSLHAGELLPGVALLAPAQADAHDGPVHVAIGDNVIRANLALLAGLQRLVTVVHPSAQISPHARIGPGCFIAACAVVAPGAELGAGVIVNHGAVVDHDVRVGDFSHVAPRSALGGGASLGARVLLGTGAVVLPGTHVCDDAVVGALALVNRPVTEAGRHVGVPARRLR